MKERRICMNISHQKVQWSKPGSYPHQVTLTGQRETEKMVETAGGGGLVSPGFEGVEVDKSFSLLQKHKT